MKFRRMVLTIIFFTIIGLFYVNQQVKIVVTSYKIEKNKHRLDYLVDKNRELNYNVSRLNSPCYLVSAVKDIGASDFKLSRNFKVEYLNVKPIEKFVTVEPKVNLLSMLLGWESKAEAETVNKTK